MATADESGQPRRRHNSKCRESVPNPRDTGFPGSFEDLTPQGSYDSDSGSSAAEKLQRDILRLQDEIRTLSASKAPARRQSIRQALQSDDLSPENLRDSFELGAIRAAKDQPPRTSARRKGGEKYGEPKPPSFTPSVSATEQPRNVKVESSARKSRRRPVAPAVAADHLTGLGAFGAAAEASSSQSIKMGATVEATGSVDRGKDGDRTVPEKAVGKKVARKPLNLEKIRWLCTARNLSGQVPQLCAL